MASYVDNALANRHFGLEAARGSVGRYATINKFGQALDCDNGIPTDIWDGADGVTSTDIWVAPTTARIHDIVSASVNDDGDPVGTGARTLRVSGLMSWSTAEVTEDIILNGTTNVPTSNSYVIINRMECLSFGSGGTNAGIIKATAQTDATITAAIQAGEGQTLMAVYGIPSIRDLYIVDLRVGVLGAPGAEVDVTLLVKLDAGSADAGFVTKERGGFSNGNPFERHYALPKKIVGAAIVKMQVNSNTNNSRISATIDAYLVDNS